MHYLQTELRASGFLPALPGLPHALGQVLLIEVEVVLDRGGGAGVAHEHLG